MLDQRQQPLRHLRVRPCTPWVRASTRSGICFNTVMSTSGHLTHVDAGVGDTVQVRRAGGHIVVGTLVEDFADFVLTEEAAGRKWATPRRWAIALSDGTLMFADDADIVDAHRERPDA